MGKRTKYTKELLEPIVKQSLSFTDVARNLGKSPVGGNITHITKRIKAFGIDTNHFIGQGWNKGKTFPKKK